MCDTLFLDYVGTFGTLAAVLVALWLGLRSMSLYRRERKESVEFLRTQIYVYLKATKTNYDRYYKETPSCSWEDYNKRNFDILECLFRSSALLATKKAESDLQGFMKFVLYFKGCPALSRNVLGEKEEEFYTNLGEVIQILSDKKTLEGKT